MAEDEEIVSGDYVIPAQGELRAGIPGDYRVLARGKLLWRYVGPPYNWYRASGGATSYGLVDFTQITSGLNLANLRVRFLAGATSGVDFPVTAVLSSEMIGLADVGAGPSPVFSANASSYNPYQLVELWTLNKLFPTDWPNGTQILMGDGQALVNASANRIYTLANGAWVQTFGGSGIKDDPIPADTSFLIRNNSTSSIHWVFAAYVRKAPLRTCITKATPSGTGQDFWVSDSVGYTRPLTSSGWGVVTAEQFLGFPVSGAQNSSASYSAVYSPSNQWLTIFGTPGGSPSLYNLAPGEGFILRLPTSAPQNTTYIVNP